MRNLRSAAIRLAHTNPSLRPYLLPVLRTAKEFATEKALSEYLHEHPDADKSKHSVDKAEKAEGGKDEGSKDEGSKGLKGMAEGKAKEIQGKLKTLFAVAKGIHKGVKEAIQAAPAKVQEFVVDPEARKKATSQAAAAIKKAPESIAKHIWESAKDELKDVKTAGKAVKKLFKKPIEQWTKEDKKALYSVAVYAAGAALSAAGGGPIVAAGAVGKSFVSHVAVKTLSHVIDAGFLHFEAGESVFQAGELLKHFIMAGESEGSDEDYEKMLIQHLTVALGAVLEKGITDKDMESVLKNEDVDPESFKQPKAPKASK